MKVLTPDDCDKREDFKAYRERGGYRGLEEALSKEPAWLIQEIGSSGLRGRGGAAFPANRKWTVALESAQAERYLVANGGEDEPGSHKDRFLMEKLPHVILEGALICARAIGAQKIYLYVNETFGPSQDSLAQALTELDAGKDFSFEQEFELFLAPPAYVAGEDSAAIEVLEGNPPQPRKKPPYPVESGYLGFPTLVHNVETLANIPFIVREGSSSFRAIGTDSCPGTMLFYLNQDFLNPGVYELPFGTPLRHLVEELGGGPKSGAPIKAILPGGPSTSFLSPNHLDVLLDPESMREAGSILGCGNVRVITEEENFLDAVLEIARFFQEEQCGKCPQCRMETSAFVMMLTKIKNGEGNAALIEQIFQVANFSRGKGDCSLIEMAAAPVVSALKLFRSDFEA